jgi:hypothetical protein
MMSRSGSSAVVGVSAMSSVMSQEWKVNGEEGNEAVKICRMREVCERLHRIVFAFPVRDVSETKKKQDRRVRHWVEQ